MSYTELFGVTEVVTDTDEYGNYKAEGSQYEWCASQSFNYKGNNAIFAGMSNARDNTSLTAWWMRSPNTDPGSVQASSSQFGEVYQGDPTWSDDANKLRAVVPAFCF